MTVVSPPRPPQQLPSPDPDALIKEARARQRRRRLRLAIFTAAAAAIAFSVYALMASGGSTPNSTAGESGSGATAHRCPPGQLGTVAFLRGSALDVLDLHRCSTRVLVRSHAAGPVQFSVDGRYVAFNGGFVPTRGGAVTRTVGVGTWSPKSDVLAVATKRGGLELLRPGADVRRLLPDGWGVLTLAFSPDGRTLAVSRSGYHSPTTPKQDWHQEIWLINVATGKRHVIFKLEPPALAPGWLQGFSPDGRWLLFWEDGQNAASLAADGLPLVALPISRGKPVTVARGELHYPDYVTWCGNSLVYVIDHGGRGVTLGDGIAVTSPPTWRSKIVLPAAGKTSWNSVACPTAAAAARGGGGLVVAGGPTNDDSPFGQEHRSLWMVSASAGATPQRLTQTIRPPARPTSCRCGRAMVAGSSSSAPSRADSPRPAACTPSIRSAETASGNCEHRAHEQLHGSYSWPFQLDWHR